MNIFNYLRKVSSVLALISAASPEIISIFTAYREAMKDRQLSYEELLDLFNRLKNVIIRIYPDFKIYL